MLALLDDRRMLLLVAAYRLNVKVVDNDLYTIEVQGIVVYRDCSIQSVKAHLRK